MAWCFTLHRIGAVWKVLKMRNLFVGLTLLFLGIFHQQPVSGLPAYSDQTGVDKQDWGYVNVRPNAFMFWWLYYARTKPLTDAPLVIWLQGGPGGSSTGFGNFMEIGPLDVQLNPRNVTWVQTANVLLIDNPVGTGYSYVTNDNAYATNNQQIADDLVTTAIAFFHHHPELQNSPLYIFSESYGGKMAAGFSQALLNAINAKKINCNFQGVAMGDSWISPVDSVKSWGPYLYSISLLDGKGLAIINAIATAVETAASEGKYLEATMLWNECESAIVNQTHGVNFYNILTNYGEGYSKLRDLQHLSPIDQLIEKHIRPLQSDDLNDLMNGPIKKKLGIPDNVTWGSQHSDVFRQLSADFMKPVYDVVDSLLDSNLSVVVYNGQLDLIVDTVGTEAWVQKLGWSGLKSFNALSWKPVSLSVSPDKPAAFVKQYQNFSFYWIMKAGHMVPSDAPHTAYKLMQLVTLLQ